MKPSAASRNDGFSLLELLVALSLTAVIGATMAMTIAQLRPMRAFEEQIDDKQIASVLADVIAHDLEGALRLPVIDVSGQSNVLMEGGSSELEFTALVPTGYERRGLREVSYQFVGDGKQARLLRRLKMRRFSSDGASSDNVEELYASDFGLRFRYLGQGEQEVWQSDFNEQNKLPRAVEISIETGGTSARVATRIVRYSSE